ncbi:MAG TPA: MFS transporter [Stellaceae bacterium]|jgi:putative MFS transporter|nr:MFS transporter [Stellaceae bacterium]
MAATASAETSNSDLNADNISGRIDRLPFLPFHFKVASILGAGTFFDGFDSLSIGAAMTMIVASFHLDYRDSGALLSAAFAGQFFGALIFGYISEHVGRRRAFIMAVTLFGLCSVGAALATSLNGIYWARVLQGVGLGGEVPVAVALFTELLSSRARGLFTLVYETMFAWGIVLAPAVALGCLTFVGPTAGWRLLFSIGGIPAFIALVAVWKLPESPRWLATKGRLAEADKTVCAMENEARRLGKDFFPLRPIAVSGERTRFLELFKGIYARRTFVVWSLWFCSYFVANGYLAWWPTLYMKIGGLPASEAMKISLAGSAIQLCITYTTAFTVDRVGRVRWFIGGFIVAAVGAVVGVIVTGVMGIHTWPALFACGLLTASGASACAGIVYVFTPELYPTRMRAWATASASSLNRIGSFAAPSIVGWVLAQWDSVAPVFAMFMVVSLFAAIVVMTLGEETARQTLEELAP